MKRNNFIKAFISGLLLISVFMFVGCSEKSELVNSPMQNESSAADYYVIEFEDAMSSIEDATLDKDMGFKPIFDFDKGKVKFDGKRDHMRRPHRKGKYLGLIFKKLVLTDTQKESIKIYMDEFRECLADPIKQFREVAKEVFEAKKEQIIAIRDQVKAGELTREEARELIKEINIATREEIENCEACIEAKEAMLVCKNALFENIASILEEDQLIIWNEWLSKLDERP